jgi:Dolichyl-phosphate-mannose-protein mannosyltransferase
MEPIPQSQLKAVRRGSLRAIVPVRAWLPVVLALAAGAALRIWMLREFPQVAGDALIYGNLAKNLLLHGRFALTDGSGVSHETLIRLPGYPLFLALCFSMFGADNYTAVAYVQIALELAGCLLLAGFVRQIVPAKFSSGASLCTLWLAVLCPFTASYAVAPLTETLTLFVIALALWALARFDEKKDWWSALCFTFAVSYSALLRPDGALLGVALAPALLASVRGSAASRVRLARMAVVCIALALIPFAMWTDRNWRAFHVVEPLAPRYANDPGESSNPGWQRWVKTWCLDFVSTYDIYWNVPGGPLDMTKLPSRAFDSPEQHEETQALAQAYEENGRDISPTLDAQFAQLAQERVQAHPLRNDLWLPLGRMADMWVRPRVENLPIDLDWWVYSHHRAETRIGWAYLGLNALYVLLGSAGLAMRPKHWPWMLLYFVLRSLLLMTIEAPEARYTLECFPMLFALGGVALYRLTCVGGFLGSMSKVKALEGSD